MLTSNTTAERRPRVAFIFYNNSGAWLGGRNYFRSLFNALYAQQDLQIEPVVFIGTHTDATEFDFPEGMHVVKHSVFDRRTWRWAIDRGCKRIFRRAILAERVLKAEHISAVSHINTDGFHGFAKIAWIADFQHLHLPHFFSTDELKRRNRYFLQTLQEADSVLVSSESALQDLRSFAPQYAGKAHVFHFCAIEPKISGLPYVARDIYGIARPYFYIPNQFWAHKNHLIAIEALAQLSVRHSNFDIVCSGALVDGRNPEHVNHLKTQISNYGLEDRFRLLGVIPYIHIAELMLGSVAVINPSLFEGWSTTVEEAKALDVPLLLSDIPVHREQCAQGEALFFSPDDPASLASQLELMLTRNNRPTDDGPRLLSNTAIQTHASRMNSFAVRFQEIVLDSLTQASKGIR